MTNNIYINTNSDIVINTRISLLRNIKGYPFPCKMTYKQSEEIASLIENALFNSSLNISKDFKLISLSEKSQNDIVSLAEKHLISPEFISSKLCSKLILSNDEKISIMINEEDHIKIQVIENGMNFEEAYKIAKMIDNAISTSLNYSFDENLGFLTQNLTDLGTGMKVSLIMHLGALRKGNSINKINSNLSKLGFALKGFYGEGADAKGGIYQLSNEIALGISEQTAIKNLKSIAMQIIYHERSLVKTITENIQMKDIIYRSLGIIKNAYLISCEEAMDLISNIRVGVASGLIENLNISADELNEIIFKLQPATLSLKTLKILSVEELDFERAKVLREIFN